MRPDGGGRRRSGYEVGPLGLEPRTNGLKVRCSNQLSYGPTEILQAAGRPATMRRVKRSCGPGRYRTPAVVRRAHPPPAFAGGGPMDP